MCRRAEAAPARKGLWPENKKTQGEGDHDPRAVLLVCEAEINALSLGRWWYVSAADVERRAPLTRWPQFSES